MTNSIAIPLKKRRRPPGFWFWWGLFWLVWNITFSIYDIVNYVMVEHLVTLICLGVQVGFGYLTWGIFKREYDKWRDGE